MPAWKYGPALPSQIREVKALRRSGVKLTEIARRLGVSYDRVRYLAGQRENRV